MVFILYCIVFLNLCECMYVCIIANVCVCVLLFFSSFRFLVDAVAIRIRGIYCLWGRHSNLLCRCVYVGLVTVVRGEDEENIFHRGTHEK